MWGDYYESDRDAYDRLDNQFAFEITCQCGNVYLNTDDGCPSCGDLGGSYSSRDATRWNEHARRMRY